jgi:predicted ATPase
MPLGSQRLHQVLVVLGWQGSAGRAGAAEGWVAREWLATLLWPECSAGQARANLRKLLLDIRALGLAGWEEGTPGLRWRPGSDLDLFAQAWVSEDWAAAAQAGMGQPLMGLDDTATSSAFLAWLQEQRRNHHQQWRAATLRALPAATPSDAAQWAEALLQADPQDPDALALVRRQTATQLAPLSAMVGRDSELLALLALLGQHRLVTVLGPGGVGKSRLARHAADACAPLYAHGSALVTLDDLSTPAAVPDRVASTLGLTLSPHASPGLALARALAPRAMLLVLDGFEAVIDAAELAPQWLAAAPGLRLLITSRERLGIDGECLLPLEGLSPPAWAADPAQALHSPAVRLFANRALAVQPQFDLLPALPAVAEICRRVGGLPLAIEWAAAWMRVMPAADLAAEMASGAGSLGADGPLAVFESSWRLLTSAERQAYASLAVFRGGFGRDAAAQVAGVQLPVLAALVDKSMLRASASGRLDMHPLVHEHARAKLLLMEQAVPLAARHAAWYLALLQQRAPVPAAEHENVLAAWHHAVQQRDAAAVEAALKRLQWSAVMGGRRNEAVAHLRDAAAHFGADTAAGSNLQAHQAWIELWLDRDESARALAQTALAVLRAASHASGMAMCLRTLGHAARRSCQPQVAVAWFEQALALPQAEGLGDLRAALHDALAMALIQDSQFESARAQLKLALALNKAAGDEVQRMYNHYNLSQSYSQVGLPEQALPWAASALELGRCCGFPFFSPYLQAESGRVLAALGRLDEAHALARLAVAGAHDTADNAALAGGCEVLARVALLRGDSAAARSALREAARACLATGNRSVGLTLLAPARQAFAGEPGVASWGPASLARTMAAIAAGPNTD